MNLWIEIHVDGLSRYKSQVLGVEYFALLISDKLAHAIVENPTFYRVHLNKLAYIVIEKWDNLPAIHPYFKMSVYWSHITGPH